MCVVSNASPKNVGENGAEGERRVAQSSASSGFGLRRNGLILSPKLGDEVFANPSSRLVEVWPVYPGVVI